MSFITGGRVGARVRPAGRGGRSPGRPHRPARPRQVGLGPRPAEEDRAGEPPRVLPQGAGEARFEGGRGQGRIRGQEGVHTAGHGQERRAVKEPGMELCI